MRHLRWVAVTLLFVGSCAASGSPAESLAEAFVGPDGGELVEPGARCVADEIVQLVADEDRIDEVVESPAALARADLGDVGMDSEDDAEALVSAFHRCDVDPDHLEVDELRGLTGAITGVVARAAYQDAVQQVAATDQQLAGDAADARACIASAIVAGVDLGVLVAAGPPSEVALADSLASLHLDVTRGLEGVGENLVLCSLELRTRLARVLALPDVPPEAARCMVAGLDPPALSGLFGAVLLLGEEQWFQDASVFDQLDAMATVWVTCLDQVEPTFEDSQFVNQISVALQASHSALEVGAALCVAGTWIDALGPGHFQALGLDPGNFVLVEDFPDNDLSGSDAQALLDAYVTCGLLPADLALDLLLTVRLEPDDVACFEASIESAAATQYVVDAFAETIDPAGPTVAAAEAALDGCGIVTRSG